MAGLIAQEVERIKSSVSLRTLDESATKQGVVLRLLSLAGWDTFDVSEVVPEYTVGNRRVDYALRPGSPNAVFIEVKRPGENLDRHQQQLLEYCFQEGVKLAALTNGWTWWLYLPLQAGSWKQRRFLTIDLDTQEPAVVERMFLDYLSLERVGSGQAVSDAEDFVESPQRAEIIGKAIADAWNLIVETPDELLVDLIAETAERICGLIPEPELVEQFLSRRVRTLADASPPPEEPARGVLRTPAQVGGQRPIRTGQASTLPITPPAAPAPAVSRGRTAATEPAARGRASSGNWRHPNLNEAAAVLNKSGYACSSPPIEMTGVDFVVRRNDGTPGIKVRCPGRLDIRKGQLGQSIHVIFQDQDGIWYLVPHDELVGIAERTTPWLESPSWRVNGWYSSHSPSRRLRAALRRFALNPTEA